MSKSNNTKQAKELLIKTIRAMPDDFALREVRSHLQQAARKLEELENKRSTTAAKITQHQQWQNLIASGLNNPHGGQRTIETIENMLRKEQNKLQEFLEKKKNKPAAVETDEETLLG